jgi:hypothetical protein
MLLDRRGFVAGSLAAAALVRMASVRAAGASAHAAEPARPLVPLGRALKETLVEKGDLGLTVRVTGLLTDPSGTPLDGAQLEVFTPTRAATTTCGAIATERGFRSPPTGATSSRP